MTRPALSLPVDRLVQRIRASTGVKMFLILTLALLPLGVLALIASLQASRTSDLEKSALLKIAATQSARKLSGELASDRAAVQLVVNTLAARREAGDICGRAEAFLNSRSPGVVQFVVRARTGNWYCASDGIPVEHVRALPREMGEAWLDAADGRLVSHILSGDQRMEAFVFYSRRTLENITDPATALQNHRITLQQGRDTLVVGGTLRPNRRGRVNEDSVMARVDPTDVVLWLTVREPPKTLARTLSLFLPLVMWFLAAGIGWLVVTQYLIRPLVELRRNVAAYVPGQVLEPSRRLRTPAREIHDLGETFREISLDVASHETEMSQSLAAQRKLTREVHHRVKNNLQIIASLINLHSRSAIAPGAIEAYGSIQRRVDALSVVHRNHYAELEENRGLSIRALVSELAASLRGSAPVDATGFTIQVKSDDMFVVQDVAVPIAFLVTELVELALLSDPHATVRISVNEVDAMGAELRIISSALRDGPHFRELLESRFQRVLTGLSRQLRSALIYDPVQGSYAMAFPATL